MMRLADIHCHILPYVDDGAEQLEEMEKLIAEQARQGVCVVCATPHLRRGMFEAGDEEVRHQFERARTFIRTHRLPVYLCRSREYYCDTRFMALLERGEVRPLGKGRTLLVEFSGRHSFEVICDRLQKILAAGYRPLAAHVERYPAVRADAGRVRQMRELGALIQVNAGSVLGREGLRQQRFCWELMKQELVDVVASDAHGLEYRPVELGLCAHKIENKMGTAYAQKVLWDDPFSILALG